MPHLVLPIHITAVGLWLGCVLTEIAFERTLLGQGRPTENLLAQLHRRVDLYIEVPAFVVVLLTGGLMLAGASAQPLLHAKIAFGLLAILANVYCVRLVLLRAAAARRGDWESFSRLDHLQHKVGAVVLLGIVIALGLGITLFAR